MQGTHDINQRDTDEDPPFDAGEAARVLNAARRDARRELSLTPPLVMVVTALIILAAYVALWLSTHH